MEEIPKGQYDVTPPPYWLSIRDTEGKLRKPIICCKCGRHVGIGLHHVHVDGTVTASFYHLKGDISPADPQGCGWHVWLKLKDYDCGDFPPEP